MGYADSGGRSFCGCLRFIKGHDMTICILSGLEIPRGHESIEHFMPRFYLPARIANDPDNLYLAIRILNSLKGALRPCEWIDQRYDICYHAYHKYNLRQANKQIVRQALNGMAIINPCQYCIARKYPQYCIDIKRNERSR